MESLSVYARQFLGVQGKPDVDDISGLSPAISIEQKGASHNPRSTVGTVTETYDYLRLIFGRIGIPYCPNCGKPVIRYSLDEIVESIFRDLEGKKIEILAPLVRGKKGEFRNLLIQTREKGFLRVRVDGKILWLEEEIPLEKNRRHTIEVVVDRVLAIRERRGRISEAVENALSLSDGIVMILSEDGSEKTASSNFTCADCGIAMPDVEPRLFSFNNPYGACKECSGLGSHEFFSEELSIDSDRSIPEGALLPWKKKHYMLSKLQQYLEKYSWDVSCPFSKLPDDVRSFVINGTDERLPMLFKDGADSKVYMGRYEGLLPWLENRWKDTESENVKEELEGYRVEDACTTCGGLRLCPEALHVKVKGYSIGDLVLMPIDDLVTLLRNMEWTSQENAIVGQAIQEVQKRLSFICDVGVGYLSLHRRADTLSGGESQRIRLATQIGSKLSGVLYVLDEPTIGLQSRDTSRLIRTLQSIRDLGNSVVVVEHDRDTMMAADAIVEGEYVTTGLILSTLATSCAVSWQPAT